MSPFQTVKEEMLYYCYVIEQNKYKYNYGRGANKTFKNILVPSKNKIPHYVNQKEVNVPFVSKPLLQKKLNFNVNEWKWFVLKDWFDEPYKANAYNSQDLIPCIEKDVAIAHITRTDENNGCKDFVVNESLLCDCMGVPPDDLRGKTLKVSKNNHEFFDAMNG